MTLKHHSTLIAFRAGRGEEIDMPRTRRRCRGNGDPVRTRPVRTFALTTAALITAGWGRTTLMEWGASADERRDRLPGDDLIADADLVATRSITIGCRPEAVWPWIAQLGQGRAGFYSYDFLENLVGCDIHSADRIVPDWQRVRPGDEIRLHPSGGLTVAVADPGRALVLRGGVPMGRTPPPFDFTWAFVLQEGRDGTTRLVVRERYRYLNWWVALLIEPTEVASYVMSQRMLRGIRDRAQRGAADATPVSLEHAGWTPDDHTCGPARSGGTHG